MLHGMVPSANNTIVPGGWSIGTVLCIIQHFYHF
jgi:hypothetical protein